MCLCGPNNIPCHVSGWSVHPNTTLTQHWVPSMVEIAAWTPHVFASYVCSHVWTGASGTQRIWSQFSLFKVVACTLKVQDNARRGFGGRRLFWRIFVCVCCAGSGAMAGFELCCAVQCLLYQVRLCVCGSVFVRKTDPDEFKEPLRSMPCLVTQGSPSCLRVELFQALLLECCILTFAYH